MNTPLPKPVSIPAINAATQAANQAANRAANNAAKQADGQEFKQVLANQVKSKEANSKDAAQPADQSNVKTRETLAKEQAQQLQRRQLQVKAGEPGQQPAVQAGQQELDPALLAEGAPATSLPVDATGQAELVDQDLNKTTDADKTTALSAELLAKDIPQPVAQPVTPAVEATPVPRVAAAVRDALSDMQPEDAGKQAIGLGVKDALADNAKLDGKLDKLSNEELAALLDKGATGTAAKSADSQAAPVTGEQGQRFAETLAQQAALQQSTASSHTAQTTAAQALAVDPRSTQVAVPFGQTGWNQAIGQKVVWMAAGGEQSASLTLNPPDLGPLQVVIHVHNGQADTTFLSDQADVRRALEDGMANLRDMMSQSGLQLGQANVRSGQQEAQSQQARSQAGQDGSNAAANEVNPVLAKAAKVMGMVDTYV